MRKQIIITVTIEEMLKALKRTYPTSMIGVNNIHKVECECQEIFPKDFKDEITINGYGVWKEK